MKRLTLTQRLIGFIFIVLVLAFGSLSLINLLQTKEIIVKYDSERIESKLEVFAKEIDGFCQRMLHITQAVSHLAQSEVNQGKISNEVIDSYIKHTMLEESGYNGLYLSWSEEINKKYNMGGDSGLWWVRDPIQANGIKSMREPIDTYYWQESEKSQWYWTPKKSGKSEWVEPYIDEFLKVKITTVANPINNKEGLFIGVVGIDFDLNAVSNIVSVVKVSKNSQPFLLTKSGSFIYYPNPDYMNKTETIETIAQKFNRPEFLLLKQQINNSPQGKIEFVDGKMGKRGLFYWTTIPTNGWILASYLPLSDVTEQAFSVLTLNIIIEILATLITIFLLLLILRKEVLVPLQLLTKQVEAFAQGDISVYSSLQQNDEIGKLARAINRMAAYLNVMADISDKIASGILTVVVEPLSEKDRFGNSFRKMVYALVEIVSKTGASAQQVKNTSLDLAGYGQLLEKDISKVNDTAHHLATVFQELSANTNSIAKNVATQSKGVTESTNSVEHINKQLHKIVTKTYGLTNIVAATQKALVTGEHSMAEATQSIKQIYSAVNITSQTMRHLTERAKAIGKIIEVINNISDQTNLLALNAAIEAARAGSHGLGFGVVADEVRRLSERTASSTGEIAKLIKDVQDSAIEVVKQMDISIALASQGFSQSSDLVTAFKHIDQMVLEVTNTSSEIKQIVSQQLADTQKTAANMDSLANIAQQLNISSQEQNSSTQEILRAVHHLRESVERNSYISQQLVGRSEDLLSYFKNLEQAVSSFTFAPDLEDSLLTNEESRTDEELEMLPKE